DAMLAIGWLTLGYGQLRSDRLQPHPVRGWAWRLLIGLALLCLGFVVLLLDNPAFSRRPVGDWPIVNLIGLAYGLPAAMLLLLAFTFRRHGRDAWATATGAAALLLGFVALTLEVRRAFV